MPGRSRRPGPRRTRCALCPRHPRSRAVVTPAAKIAAAAARPTSAQASRSSSSGARVRSSPWARQRWVWASISPGSSVAPGYSCTQPPLGSAPLEGAVPLRPVIRPRSIHTPTPRFRTTRPSSSIPEATSKLATAFPLPGALTCQTSSWPPRPLSRSQPVRPTKGPHLGDPRHLRVAVRVSSAVVQVGRSAVHLSLTRARR